MSEDEVAQAIGMADQLRNGGSITVDSPWSHSELQLAIFKYLMDGGYDLIIHHFDQNDGIGWVEGYEIRAVVSKAAS